MNQYKLLKELPHANIGCVFAWDKESERYRYYLDNDYEYVYSVEQIEQLTLDGWFEKVEIIEEDDYLKYSINFGGYDLTFEDEGFSNYEIKIYNNGKLNDYDCLTFSVEELENLKNVIERILEDEKGIK